MERGVALILALLVLSFLTVVGSALLTTSTIDLRVSDNFRSAAGALYVAEAGIEDARELLRTSNRTAAEWLAVAAGPDGRLSSADDAPLIADRSLTEVGGMAAAGSYDVRIGNDVADGAASVVDTNGLLTLSSSGRLGSSRKTLEVVVSKERFPIDSADPRLETTAGLESLVASVRRFSSDIYSAATITDLGGPGDFRVVVVDGDLRLGPGNGYGLLVVRGELTVVGDIVWDGVIAVVGQGVLRWNPGVSGTVNGATLTARTLSTSGELLSSPQGLTYVVTNPAEVLRAGERFPYRAISVRER